MHISGLQKLTLLDYPNHLAAILFLDGCNFRCPFCHNSSLVLPEAHSIDEEDIYSEEEILQFLKKRTGLLDGVCISGGEPTLYPELPAFISRIKDLGYHIKLDTNGTNPEMLRVLCEKNLVNYVAMDIKAGRTNYAKVAGIRMHQDGSTVPALLEQVMRSVGILKNSSIDYEFRTTAVQGLHTIADFEDISKWLAGCKNYYLQSFRDCDSILLPNHNFSAFSEEKMLQFLNIVKKTIPNAALREMV